MFKWLKSLFREKPKSTKSPVADFGIKPLEYKEQLLCKLHPNYSGATEPTNNCNVCWEIYNQKRSKWHLNESKLL